MLTNTGAMKSYGIPLFTVDGTRLVPTGGRIHCFQLEKVLAFSIVGCADGRE